MVYTGDCHGLRKLIAPSGTGSAIYVPRGTIQESFVVGDSATILVSETEIPTARALSFFNESASKVTIYLSIGSTASDSNYTYPLHQYLMLEGVIDGGELWSAIAPVGEVGIIRVAIAPLVKIEL